MFRLPPAVIGLLLASATACAVAEPRFYQVIDAQGRMQTIMAPADEGSADAPAPSTENDAGREERKAEASLPSTQPASDKSATVGESAPSQVANPAGTTGDASGATASEDDYIDSEELERTNFNPTKKKRFYLLDDGMGARVEESDGQLTGVVENGPDLFPQQIEAPYREFEANSVEITGASALQSLLSQPSLCLDKKILGKAVALGKGIPQSVPIDRKTWSFVGGGGVVQAFRVGGEGLRKVSLHSYAKSDKKPSFVMPVIAVADSKGCIVRALADRYFETWFAATKSRHHHLEGSLIMGSTERFVLVLLPRQELVREHTGFSLTDDGMFAVKWHE